MMWAARYSRDIAVDVARGYSYTSRRAATARDAWAIFAEYAAAHILYHPRYEHDDFEAALDAAIEALEARGLHAAPVEGGWAIALPGLSAYAAETVREAIELALRDTRFRGMPLWVFPCVVICDDQDAATHWPGAAVVRPAGRARRVDGLLRRMKGGC